MYCTLYFCGDNNYAIGIGTDEIPNVFGEVEVDGEWGDDGDAWRGGFLFILYFIFSDVHVDVNYILLYYIIIYI